MAYSTINDQDVFKRYITPGDFIYPDEIVAKLRAKKINVNDLVKDSDLFGFSSATSVYIILGLLDYLKTYKFVPSNIVLDIYDKKSGKHSYINFDNLKSLQKYFDNRLEVTRLNKPANTFDTLYYTASVSLIYQERNFECVYTIRNVDNEHHIEVNYQYNKKDKNNPQTKTKIENQVNFIKNTYNDYLYLYDKLEELYIQELYYINQYGDNSYVIENNNFEEFMKLYNFNQTFPYKNLKLY